MEEVSRQVVIVLPDIRSLHNVGSFFRTSDAAGVQKIILCGTTGTPENPKLKKVSLGSEQTVPWRYEANVLRVVQELKAEGYQIVAVEYTDTSELYSSVTYSNKVALIFGAEVSGVPTELLKAADVVAHLPMVGKKKSLNVSVVGGIMLYHLLP